MIEIIHANDVVSVTFPSETFLGESIVPRLRDELQEILNEQEPSTVRFDLTDVAMVTSEVLGFFVSLHGQNVRVQLCNPSDDVRTAVELTKLDQLLELVSDQPTTE